jgi:hypothetical protein
MLFQRNFLDTPSVISSQALEPSRMPSETPVGPTPAESGPCPALASLSARQAGERGLLTSGTYGRPGSISRASADLTSSLASRLRATTASLGSTLFGLTWKRWDTPSGRWFYLLRASVRLTDDTGYGSWPTTVISDGTWGPRKPDVKRGSTPGLLFVANLASWPTPSAMGAGAVDLERLEQRRAECKERTGNGNGFGLTLDQAAPLLLRDQAQLTDSGPTPSGSPAGTERPGQLNAAFSRWLMALPPEWCEAAIAAYRSMPMRRRKRGS